MPWRRAGQALRAAGALRRDGCGSVPYQPCPACRQGRRQGLDRAAGRSEPDRFEIQREAFFDAARATYRARADAEPERFRIIDASQDLNGVLAQLQRSVAALLNGVGP